MFLREKNFSSSEYLQVANEYKWRALRLSILITILTTLIVNTIPSIYLGSVRLKISTDKSIVLNGAHEAVKVFNKQNDLENIYSEALLNNLVEALVVKLRKFGVVDLNSDLNRAIAGSLIIDRMKQRLRVSLPFIPQDSSNILSPKQIRTLKNDYDFEHVIQNLDVRYSLSAQEVYVDYRDQNANFAIIIAKLAADLYLSSITETNIQMFESILEQISKSGSEAHVIVDKSDAANVNYHKFYISNLDNVIELSFKKIKFIQRRVKELVQMRKDMTLVQSLVREHGSNIGGLLEHKQVLEYPLIQPYQRNVELAEIALNDLALLAEDNTSEIITVKQALLSHKAILIDQVTRLASNINTLLRETERELSTHRDQLKISKQNRRRLTVLKKELNQLPPSAINHQTSQLQNLLSQVATITAEQSTGEAGFIDNYTTKLLEPNKVLIVVLSFFSSMLIVALLVMFLVYLKSMNSRRYLHISVNKSCN